MPHHDPRTPLYGIAVAAQLTGVPEATLRLLETYEVIAPQRSAGGTRRYSDHDVERVLRVTVLRKEGINLAGVRRVLALEDENAELRAEIADGRDG